MIHGPKSMSWRQSRPSMITFGIECEALTCDADYATEDSFALRVPRLKLTGIRRRREEKMGLRDLYSVLPTDWYDY
jgi:hypothetical protein